MNYAAWNDALARWFLNGPPSSYVYLRVDDAELRRMSDELGLGLDDPAADLISAVASRSISSLSDAGAVWRRGDRAAVPPWLPHLAVTVLVVERETDAGRLRFYEPVSAALNRRPRLSQEEYNASIYAWWMQLAKWLTEDQGGRRGLPTWKRLPPSPAPRCVIGHPYTQILLRREDRQDLDDFLKSVDDLDEGDVEVFDQGAAAIALLEQFRTWAARNRASVSGRLRAVLEGANENARQSLAYVILDRLMDTVEPTAIRPQDRRLRVVPSIDDWTDRRIRFSVIAPADVSPAAPLIITVASEALSLLEPGQPVHLPLDVDAVALKDGFSLETPEGLGIWFRPRDLFVLAAREWDEWCGVDEVEAGEEVYVLVAEAGAAHVEEAIHRPEPNGRVSVPEGWRLYGPTTVEGTLAHVRLRASWNAVPRLAGGLALAPRQYLAGGEPRLVLPEGGAREVLVDSVRIELPAGAAGLDLSALGLDSGEHSVELGPYRIPLQTISVLQPSALPELVGRRVNGDVIFGDAHDGSFFSGALVVPSMSNIPPTLCAIGDRALLFGPPGVVEEVALGVAAWAASAALAPHVVEPLELSSYPDGVRPVALPWWVATRRDGEWWVISLPTADDEPRSGRGQDDKWMKRIAEIGAHPRIATGARPYNDGRTEELARQWLAYSGLEDGA